MLAWILSAFTIAVFWLMGNRSVWGPRLGVLSQLLWCYFAVSTKNYGLLPCCGLLAVVHIRNCLKWRKERR
jgi:hypothetical protein